MAHNLLPLLRSYAGDPPGRQINPVTGQPSNSKERVTYVMNISSYPAGGTGGEPLTPAELGLKTVDYFDATPVSLNNGTFPTGAAPLFATWNSSTQKLIMGTVHGGSEATSGQAAVAIIEAVGEGVHDSIAI